MKEKIKRWFARPLVRHAAAILVSVFVSQGVARLGVDPATANTVGQAVGQTVEG